MRIWRAVRGKCSKFGIWPEPRANLQKQPMSVAVAMHCSRANANVPVTSFWRWQRRVIWFHNPNPIIPASSNQLTPTANVRGRQRSRGQATGWARSDFSRERWQYSKHPASLACPSAALVQYLCFFKWFFILNSSLQLFSLFSTDLALLFK